MRVKYNFSAKLTRKSRKSANTNDHRVAFPAQAREVIRTSNIILEIIDARFIDKTRNKELEEEVKKSGKKIIFVLNKVDLVNIDLLKKNYDLSSMQPYVLFSVKNKIGRSRLRNIINIEAKKSKFGKAKVGIIGYPNTGKSSLINVLSGGKRVGTSPNAGFTKTIQKVRFSKNILLLDSPGVISSGEENSLDANVVKRHIEIGVKDYEKVKYPDLVVYEIMKAHKRIFDDFYGVDSEEDADILLEILGRKWQFLKKGGIVDTDRAARKILKDWQEGKIRPKQ
jgi:ribosome biogenesis GTPase A